MGGGYKGAVDSQGQSRAHRTAATGDGSDYTVDDNEDVVYADTSSSTLTVTLPDSANIQDGKEVRVIDQGGNAGTNNITVTSAKSGDNVNGSDQDITLNTNRVHAVFVWDESNSTWLQADYAP